MAIPYLFRRRFVGRLLVFAALGFFLRTIFGPGSDDKHEIRGHNVIERVVSRSDKLLDVQKYPFLQARIGRDEEDDLLSDMIKSGVDDFWDRFQKPL